MSVFPGFRSALLLTPEFLRQGAERRKVTIAVIDIGVTT